MIVFMVVKDATKAEERGVIKLYIVLVGVHESVSMY